MDENSTASTVARRLALVMLLGIAFAASAMLTIYLLFQAGEVEVPNLVGMSQIEAERAVRRAGLGVKARRQHFDAEVPEGAISEQDPVAGFPVKEGFEVKIDISKGPDPLGRPDEPPPPGGPTTPIDGPKLDEPIEKKKTDDKKKKADEEAKKAEEEKKEKEKEKADDKEKEADEEKKKSDDEKKSKTSDEPAAAKSGTDAKPKSGNAAKSGDSKRSGDANKPNSQKPKPKSTTPPPSR